MSCGRSWLSWFSWAEYGRCEISRKLMSSLNVRVSIALHCCLLLHVISRETRRKFHWIFCARISRLAAEAVIYDATGSDVKFDVISITFRTVLQIEKRLNVTRFYCLTNIVFLYFTLILLSIARFVNLNNFAGVAHAAYSKIGKFTLFFRWCCFYSTLFWIHDTVRRLMGVCVRRERSTDMRQGRLNIRFKIIINTLSDKTVIEVSSQLQPNSTGRRLIAIEIAWCLTGSRNVRTCFQIVRKKLLRISTSLDAFDWLADAFVTLFVITAAHSFFRCFTLIFSSLSSSSHLKLTYVWLHHNNCKTPTRARRHAVDSRLSTI